MCQNFTPSEICPHPGVQQVHPRGLCPKLCFLLPFFCFSAIGLSNHFKTSSIFFSDFTKLFSSFDITQQHQIYPSQTACLIHESPPIFSSRIIIFSSLQKHFICTLSAFLYLLGAIAFFSMLKFRLCKAAMFSASSGVLTFSALIF